MRTKKEFLTGYLQYLADHGMATDLGSSNHLFGEAIAAGLERVLDAPDLDQKAEERNAD